MPTENEHEKIKRLLNLQGTDAGFFTLAVFSLIESFLRKIIPTQTKETTFYELIESYKEQSAHFHYDSYNQKYYANNKKIYSLMKDLVSSQFNTNEVRHKFGTLSEEEAIAAVALLEQFATIEKFTDINGIAHKKPIFRWVDAMVIAIPLGYTFGRLGNFLNGELYGRITTVPWGIVFPYAQRFSVSIDWVREFAEKIGMEISPTATLINLPRHPSQLYEAFFEGIVLFAIQWLIYKKLKGKRWDGVLSGSYTIGYGLFRFFIEYFREPDADIGYRIAADPTAAIYTNTSLFNISTGQILCMVMIAGGIAILVGTYFRKVKSEK